MKPRFDFRVARLYLLLNTRPGEQAGEELACCGRVVPVIASGGKSADQQGLAGAGRVLDGRDVPVGVIARRLPSGQLILLQEVAATDLFVSNRKSQPVQQVGSELDIS